MLANYFKVAIRNILKHRSYSIINIIGLAGSTAITILITFYALSVLSYDQFHKGSDQIYFMYRDRATETGRIPVYDTWFPMAEAAKNDLPGIKSFTRFFQAGQSWVSYGDKRFEQGLTYADSSFFSFFSFPLVAGDRKTLLDGPNSVVISEAVAKKFFGAEDPLGKVLNLGFSNDRTVTGVIGAIPGNSSFTFEVVIPLNTRLVHQFLGENLWGGSFCTSFVRLDDNTSIQSIRQQANVIMKKYVNEAEQGNVLFLPLKDYNNEFTDQKKYAYTLLIVAIGILLISSINFTNLATAQSLMRTTEVGVRKVMGATRPGLVRQFISESLLLTFFALVIGGLLAEMLLPFFGSLIGLDIPINFVENPELIGLLALLGLIIGVLSGSYPSFYISAFKPSEVLKGAQAKKGSMLVRNGLVVLQFSLAIILISAVAIIRQQVGFMRGYDVKFDKDNVVVIPIAVRDFEDRESAISRIVAFKEQLGQLPGVISVTASNGIPGDYPGSFSLFLPQGKEDINPLDYQVADVEEDYFGTYGIKLIAGRNFIPHSQNDRDNSIILNEAAVKDIGWKDPIGKKLLYPMSRRPLEVIGVVEDFNYASLKQRIMPIVHYFGGDSARNYRYISVKLKGEAREATLGQMATTLQAMKFDKAYEYFFPAERMEALYAPEDNLIRILTYATIFAIFVACLGLYALASFTIMLRTKEIAIRKTLGASVPSIVGLFSRSYFALVLASIAVAVPLAWYAMAQWLEGFAFRTSIGWATFAFAGGMALAISFLTVSIHGIRAGLANPVKSLRAE